MSVYSDLNKVIARSMYSKRERHQTLGGSSLSAIFDTNWSTLQNSSIFNNYGAGVNVGNFQILFNNDGNVGKQYNNGEWIRNKSGSGATYNISVNGYGHILSATPNNNGTGYKVGDRFSVIAGGGIEGLVEIASIGSNGSVTGLKVVEPGRSYPTSTSLVLNDDFWSYNELVTDRVSQDTLAKNDDWKLKLDFKNLNSFALYGSLGELIRSSFEDIILKFPASLWMIPTNLSTGLNYELQNPFNIDVYTESNVSDNIKIFIPNYHKYEVVQTHWVECHNLCDDPTLYSKNVLSDCISDISNIEASYRYVYVKKPKYHNNPKNPNDPYINGFVGVINDPVYADPSGGFTVNNNELIVTSKENTLLNSLNAYHFPVKLLDNIEIRTTLRGGSPSFASAYPCATCNGQPSVTGSGSGATATVTVSDGAILRIEVVNPGSNYDPSVTQIVINDPTGSGATATPIIDSDGSITHIRLTAAGSGYTDPTVTIIDNINHREASAVAVMDDGVNVINITNGGSGYTDPTVTITGNGTGATAEARINGGIDSITVTNGGNGYTSPVVTITDPTGTGARGQAVLGNGRISQVIITNPGVNYSNATVATINDPTGAGAVLQVNVDRNIQTITVTDNGSGYTSPVVTITDGTGTGAVATANLDCRIDTLSIVNPGSGYINPQVVISDPTGSGAVGEATVNRNITSINVTNPGQNYRNPSVSIVDSNGVDATANAVLGGSGAITNITIDNPGTGYTNPVATIQDPTGTGAVVTVGASRGIGSISIINEGDDYVLPVVTITDPTGTGATATATIDDKIRSIEVVNQGTNYTDPQIVITDLTGTGATATAVSNWGIDTITLTNPGTSYIDPTITITDPTGIDATATATSNTLSFVTVTNGGSGYINPTVSISDPNGNGGVLTPIVTGGVITGITVTNQGQGYTSPTITIEESRIDTISVINGTGNYSNPRVTISDPTGTGAMATAVFDGVLNTISAITVLNGGTGYTNPRIIITDPTGTGARASAVLTGGVITTINVDRIGNNYTAPVITVVDEHIDTITLTNGGVGYTNPYVTITDPTGYGAVITPVLTGGVITALTIDDGGTEYSSPIINIVENRIDSVTITNGGSGYSRPTVVITDPTGTGATATVTQTTGVIDSITITNKGSSYTAPTISFADEISSLNIVNGGNEYINPILNISDPTGTGATAIATVDGAVGAISNITITNGGSNYANPLVRITDPTGTGASASVTQTGGVIDSITVNTKGHGYTSPTITITDRLTSVTLVNPGSGYVGPTVTITDPGGIGTGASATATIDGQPGQIASITLVNGGSGYVAPTVTIVDPTGIGAIATAMVSGGVIQSINVTNKGSGYTSPTVRIGDCISTINVTNTGNNSYSSTTRCDITDSTGSGSGAIGVVNVINVGAGQVITISVSSRGQNYISPVVTIIDNMGGGSGATATAVVGTGATATATIATGAIQTLTLNSPGLNYSNPIITINDATGTGATATALIGTGATFNITRTNGIINSATINNKGSHYTSPTITIGDRIVSMTIVNGGTGYTSPTVTVTDPTGRQSVVTATQTAGVITAINVINGGNNFTSPTVTINDPTGTGAVVTATVAGTGAIINGVIGTGATATLTIGGTGATATATVAGTGGVLSATLGTGTVSSIIVTNGGFGYTAPVVTILDPTGTGAIATASITGTGATATASINYGIQSITLTNPGKEYTNPTVSITDSGGLGVGASATATVNKGITEVIVTNPGSGYTNPTIIITDPTGSGVVLNIIRGIIAITVVAPGTGYTNPTVTITDPSGTGATALANINSGIDSITFTPGSNYSDPIVVVSDPNGSGATFITEIDKFIQSINVVNGGYGYLTPIVTINDVTGTGATATAVVDTSLSSVSILNGGNNYTSPTITILEDYISEILIVTPGSGYTAPVVTITDPTGTGATAVATIGLLGEIDGITVINRGIGYTAPTITITDPTGFGALVVGAIDGIGGTVSFTTNCIVSSITVVNGGTGYTNNPVVTITDPTGVGATATATVNTAISSITILSPGNNYTSPSITISDSTGSGATAHISTSFSITGINILSPGNNYTSPIVTILDPTGIGALATATVDTSISSIVITNPGSGYTSATVTITDPTGTGASAYALVGNSVAKIIIVDGGTGYINPQITITDPTGTGAVAEAAVDSNGTITSIFVKNNGTGYSDPQVEILEIDLHNKASAIATVDNSIASITLTNGGTSYINPIVIIRDTCGGNGVGAIVDYEVVGGVITSLTLVSGGTGYRPGCVAVEIKDEIVCEAHSFTINYLYNDRNGEPCDLIKTEVEVDGGTMFSEGTLTNPSVSFHIRPKTEHVEKFFNDLNDFQRIILNRNTIPTYTSTFNAPIPNEMGDFVGIWGELKYSWPIPDGWNVDISTNAFNDFIINLSNISQYLDNTGGRCDNLYRMLTHESLKNLDWSFQRIEDDALADAHIIGESKFKKILRIYGREYDEIKKYIHGIEIMNNLTYDERDNYPDAILKINVEYAGWKALSLEDKNNIGFSSGQLYHGWAKDYNSHDLELEFYRRLLINSTHLAKWKGTKHGLEMIMNLFGIDRRNWEIKEYVYLATGSNFMSTDKKAMFNNKRPASSVQDGYYYRVATGAVTYNGRTYYPGQGFSGCPNGGSATGGTFYIDEIESIAYLNSKRGYTLRGDVFYHGELTTEDEYEYNNPDDLHNLCIERWYYGDYKVCPICGPYNPSTGMGGGIIPYPGTGRKICNHCHGTGQVREYVGVPAFKGNTNLLYYQQKGGWYQDTMSTMGLANSMTDLFMTSRSDLQEGVVYFVKSDGTIGSTHYWVLVDLDRWNSLGGWHQITQSEMNGFSFTGNVSKDNITVNINLMLQIQNENEGNNPHTGSIEGYDDGMSYLQNIGSKITDCNGTNVVCRYNPVRSKVLNCQGLFKYVLDNSPECIWPHPQYSNLENIGFLINCELDTKKCWAVYSNDDDKLHIDNSYNILEKHRRNLWCTPPCDFKWYSTLNTRKVNYSDQTPEHYRIINVKNITFAYYLNTDPNYYAYDENEFINYILPYIEDMLPSDIIIDLQY